MSAENGEGEIARSTSGQAPMAPSDTGSVEKKPGNYENPSALEVI